MTQSKETNNDKHAFSMFFFAVLCCDKAHISCIEGSLFG